MNTTIHPHETLPRFSVEVPGYGVFGIPAASKLTFEIESGKTIFDLLAEGSLGKIKNVDDVSWFSVDRATLYDAYQALEAAPDRRIDDDVLDPAYEKWSWLITQCLVHDAEVFTFTYDHCALW